MALREAGDLHTDFFPLPKRQHQIRTKLNQLNQRREEVEVEERKSESLSTSD